MGTKKPAGFVTGPAEGGGYWNEAGSCMIGGEESPGKNWIYNWFFIDSGGGRVTSEFTTLSHPNTIKHTNTSTIGLAGRIGRDIDVVQIPTVIDPRRGNPVHIDLIEPLTPKPKSVQFRGDLVVGPADVLVRDDMPSEFACCLLLVWHDAVMLENSRRKTSRQRELSMNVASRFNVR